MVKWTDPAKARLQQIFEFIALDSHHYARKVTREIVAKSKTLKDMPRRGRVVPEIGNDDFRELFLYSYRIMYEIMNAHIYIIAVVPMCNDFKAEDISNRLAPEPDQLTGS